MRRNVNAQCNLSIAIYGNVNKNVITKKENDPGYRDRDSLLFPLLKNFLCSFEKLGQPSY